MKKGGAVNKKGIWLSVLMAVAVGLIVLAVVVGIVVVKQPKTSIETPEQSDVINMEEVQEKVFAAEAEGMDKIIGVYQEYIDKANADEKVELYNERIQTILQFDYENKQYGKQVIDDTIAIDDILQSVSSAAQVVNVANEYNESDLAVEYVRIMQEREATVGVNVDVTGGRG